MQRETERGSVMQIIHEFPCYGAETFVVLLSKELEQLGIAVSVMTIRGSGARNPLGRVPVLSAQRASRYDLGFFFRMLKILREQKPSVVHTHGYHGKLWGRLAARIAGIKNIVHTEHNSDLHSTLFQGMANAALHHYTKVFITFSETLGRRLVLEDRVPSDRIVVIPNGVPEPARKARHLPAPRIEPPLPEGSKIVLHVGRLMRVKNQQLAIRACRDLCELRPNQRLYLLLAGAGHDDRQLQELAAELDIADRVRFLGYRDDIDDLMRLSNVLLLTSLNEAMPMTVLQAMYAGVPIVTTPWNGARELLEAGALGCITDSYDPVSVSRALADRFDHPERAMKTAEAAHFAVRTRFDIRLAARRHADLYTRLAEHVAP
jgi:glycosyltransferase involved in cell wall biosynthesis